MPRFSITSKCITRMITTVSRSCLTCSKPQRVNHSWTKKPNKKLSWSNWICFSSLLSKMTEDSPSTTWLKLREIVWKVRINWSMPCFSIKFSKCSLQLQMKRINLKPLKSFVTWFNHNYTESVWLKTVISGKFTKQCKSEKLTTKL